jgi:uncharacterized protein YndB with AHSA1/START domain
MKLRFEVYAKIKKPVEDVFDAVYDPKKLSGYFTTGGSSAPLKEGTSVTWNFADFPGAFPVHVKQVIMNEKIMLEWANNEGKNNQVEIIFEALNHDSTLLKIRESGWNKMEKKSLDGSYGNCMGWSQMLLCLKVYVEYGKNLREFLY